MSSGITHFSISHFFLRRMILGTKIWSLDVHSYWSVIVFMAAQHTELENRHVHAHVFVFIFITVSDLCVLWYYRLRKGISSILHKSIGILTWKIWQFCIRLPYSVLLERWTSCGTRKKGIWVQRPGFETCPHECCHLVELCCKLSGRLHHLVSLRTILK